MRSSAVTFVVFLALAGASVAYYLACKIWPFTACGRCEGSGRRRSPSGRNWRSCKKCKGSGTRLRTGRRIWNWLAGQADRAF